MTEAQKGLLIKTAIACISGLGLYASFLLRDTEAGKMMFTVSGLILGLAFPEFGKLKLLSEGRQKEEEETK